MGPWDRSARGAAPACVMLQDRPSAVPSVPDTTRVGAQQHIVGASDVDRDPASTEDHELCFPPPGVQVPGPAFTKHALRQKGASRAQRSRRTRARHLRAGGRRARCALPSAMPGTAPRPGRIRTTLLVAVCHIVPFSSRWLASQSAATSRGAACTECCWALHTPRMRAVLRHPAQAAKYDGPLCNTARDACADGTACIPLHPVAAERANLTSAMTDLGLNGAWCVVKRFGATLRGAGGRPELTRASLSSPAAWRPTPTPATPRGSSRSRKGTPRSRWPCSRSPTTPRSGRPWAHGTPSRAT